VRYRVLGFEDSGVRIQESGVKILVYLMRLGNAIFLEKPGCRDFSAEVSITVGSGETTSCALRGGDGRITRVC
jgi:hypothetical protein